MAGDLVVSTINGGPIGAKNAIINGSFGINQRGVSGTVTLSAGAYGHDRWKAGASGCTYTFATSENVTTLTISAGSLIQVIEGLNLNSGTYTLSWTGTAQGKIGAGSYAGSGVTGTATGGTNLNIEFGTGTVSLVQFEPGSVATPFERRPFTTELQLCQRYFEKSYNLSDAVAAVTDDGVIEFAGSTNSFNDLVGSVKFATAKRSDPTMTFYNRTSGANTWEYARSGASGTASVTTSSRTGQNSFVCFLNAGSSWVVANMAGHWTASSEL